MGYQSHLTKHDPAEPGASFSARHWSPGPGVRTICKRRWALQLREPLSKDKSPPGPIRRALNGAALLLAWLLVAGLGAGIESPLAWLAVIGLVAAFVMLHGALGLPRDANRDRAKGWSTEDFVRFGIPISVLLVIGDVFWLIARTQLDLESGRTPAPMMLAIVLLFPLVEEFGFRLWIQTPLEERVGPLAAVGFVALGFAMLHSAEFPVPQFIGGVGFGVALVVTGTIWVAIAMHALQNGLVVGLELVPGIEDWAVGLADSGASWIPVLSGVSWIAAAVLIVYWYFTRAAKRST